VLIRRAFDYLTLPELNLCGEHGEGDATRPELNFCGEHCKVFVTSMEFARREGARATKGTCAAKRGARR
jgi:hypothetical protein